jgi:hypothetical protein
LCHPASVHDGFEKKSRNHHHARNVDGTLHPERHEERDEGGQPAGTFHVGIYAVHDCRRQPERICEAGLGASQGRECLLRFFDERQFGRAFRAP